MSGIYIHIPFCKQACSYCDFHFSTSLKNKNQLVDSIINELTLRRNYLNDNEIQSIYFGGGTPSLMPAEDINRIINKIQNNFKVKNNAEITLEGNPDDLTKEKLINLNEIGINRLSVGIQSFFDEDLTWMKRAHNSSQSHQVIENINNTGFDNYTIDLIYGSPFLSNDDWQRNLEYLTQYNIPHFSAYSLTVEEKTLLSHQINKGIIPTISDNKTAEQFEILMEFAAINEYNHYEISNFCKPGYQAIHNYAYWQGKPYLGIGPSAHSFNGKSRSSNIANNNLYIKALNNNEIPETVEQLTLTDKYNELILIKLRIAEGVNIHAIKEIGDEFVAHFIQNIVNWINKGLIIKKGENYQLSRDGKFFADQITADLFFI